MKNDKIHAKNKETGKAEVINQRNIEELDWGFRFFVDSEMDAFKAAYQYRNSPHGTMVEFAGGLQSWMVTVFNAHPKEIGLDGAR